jgi:hypothetical protein
MDHSVVSVINGINARAMSASCWMHVNTMGLRTCDIRLEQVHASTMDSVSQIVQCRADMCVSVLWDTQEHTARQMSTSVPAVRVGMVQHALASSGATSVSVLHCIVGLGVRTILHH